MAGIGDLGENTSIAVLANGATKRTDGSESRPYLFIPKWSAISAQESGPPDSSGVVDLLGQQREEHGLGEPPSR